MSTTISRSVPGPCLQTWSPFGVPCGVHSFKFGVHSGSVPNPFRIHSGSFRVNSGSIPCLSKNAFHKFTNPFRVRVKTMTLRLRLNFRVHAGLIPGRRHQAGCMQHELNSAPHRLLPPPNAQPPPLRTLCKYDALQFRRGAPPL